MTIKTPLVSICCITYNHKDYIREALEGFVNQNTLFDYEIIVHDDASTDGTAEIVREYASKYPDIITGIYQVENQYSKGVSPSLCYVWPKAKGKYIALCEGDDYWIDEYKLQRQVDFLEKHEDYGLVHTNHVRLVNGKCQIPSVGQVTNGRVFKQLLVHDFYIATLTVCVRADLLLQCSDEIQFVLSERKWLMRDYPLWLQASVKTKVGYIDEVTSVYRVREESVSHSKSRRKSYNFFLSVYNIKMYFAEQYGVCNSVKEKIQTWYYSCIVSYPEYNFEDAFYALYYLLKKRIFRFTDLLRFFRHLVWRMKD